MLFKELYYAFGRLICKILNRKEKLLMVFTLSKKIIYIEFVYHSSNDIISE